MPLRNFDFQGLFTPWRLTWYPRAYLFALCVGLLIAILTGNGATTLTGRLGGDYPAFYAAGKIIAQRDWPDLYNSEKQMKIQDGLYPGQKHVFMPFPYPPFVAVAYYPLSLINYRLSYVVHTTLMIAALFLSVWLLCPLHEFIRKYYLLFASLALSFYPMFRAVTGGQNTAVTFLLIVLSWRAALAKKEVLAGIIAGLLLFKPQFALPLIGLYILSGRWRVGIGAVSTGLILYLIGTLISGPGWIAGWYNYTAWLSEADAGINYDKAVSWIGFFQAVMGWKNHLALILGWGMSLATAIFLVCIWTVGKHKLDLTAQLGISTAALVLIPPHVNYYDAGLVLFTCFSIASKNIDRPWMPLGLIWVLGLTQPLSSFLGFSMLFPVSLFALILSIRTLGRPATRFDCPAERKKSWP